MGAEKWAWMGSRRVFPEGETMVFDGTRRVFISKGLRARNKAGSQKPFLAVIMTLFTYGVGLFRAGTTAVTVSVTVRKGFSRNENRSRSRLPDSGMAARE